LKRDTKKVTRRENEREKETVVVVGEVEREVVEVERE
jgi:hypothetical protein